MRSRDREHEETGHPFYVGVLFVPQPSLDADTPHPLAAAFIEAGRLAPR